jgi:hypothetical protein
MGFFVTSANLAPAITNALRSALEVDPAHLPDPQGEAASRATNVVQQLTTQIAWPRLIVAVIIAFFLLGLAIWTATQANMADISKGLMTSFQSFSGLVVGLLGGEVATSKR